MHKPPRFLLSLSSFRCEYVSRLGVFKNNEHVMVTTILELTEVFFGGGGPGGVRGPGTGGEAAVKEALKEYIRVASFVLLRLKLRQQMTGSSGSVVGSVSALGFKSFCMYAFLDKFIEQCPQVSIDGRRGTTCSFFAGVVERQTHVISHHRVANISYTSFCPWHRWTEACSRSSCPTHSCTRRTWT